VSLALVFPGQGSQKVGMGLALVGAFPESKAVFEEVDRAVGFALSTLCFEGPEETLQLTANTQPAILATSLAAYRALARRGVSASFLAGHSLGEYSALVAAGSLSLADAVVAVRRRGEYMQEAVPRGEGAMAAVLALDLPAVQKACEDAAQGECVAPANVNAPDQVVIAGHSSAVARAIQLCKAAGARRAILLPVSAPFHCSLMAPAQVRLERDLELISFEDPAPPVIRNVDARIVRTAAEARDGLLRQVTAPVLWRQTVERLQEEGVDTLIEVGPGTVLSGLARRIAPGLRVLNVEDPTSLERTLGSLPAAALEA